MALPDLPDLPFPECVPLPESAVSTGTSTPTSVSARRARNRMSLDLDALFNPKRRRRLSSPFYRSRGAERGTEMGTRERPVSLAVVDRLVGWRDRDASPPMGGVGVGHAKMQPPTSDYRPPEEWDVVPAPGDGAMAGAAATPELDLGAGVLTSSPGLLEEVENEEEREEEEDGKGKGKGTDKELPPLPHMHSNPYFHAATVTTSAQPPTSHPQGEIHQDTEDAPSASSATLVPPERLGVLPSPAKSAFSLPGDREREREEWLRSVVAYSSGHGGDGDEHQHQHQHHVGPDGGESRWHAAALDYGEGEVMDQDRQNGKSSSESGSPVLQPSPVFDSEGDGDQATSGAQENAERDSRRHSDAVGFAAQTDDEVQSLPVSAEQDVRQSVAHETALLQCLPNVASEDDGREEEEEFQAVSDAQKDGRRTEYDQQDSPLLTPPPIFAARQPHQETRFGTGEEQKQVQQESPLLRSSPISESEEWRLPASDSGGEEQQQFQLDGPLLPSTVYVPPSSKQSTIEMEQDARRSSEPVDQDSPLLQPSPVFAKEETQYQPGAGKQKEGESDLQRDSPVLGASPVFSSKEKDQSTIDKDKEDAPSVQQAQPSTPSLQEASPVTAVEKTPHQGTLVELWEAAIGRRRSPSRVREQATGTEESDPNQQYSPLLQHSPIIATDDRQPQSGRSQDAPAQQQQDSPLLDPSPVFVSEGSWFRQSVIPAQDDSSMTFFHDSSPSELDFEQGVRNYRESSMAQPQQEVVTQKKEEATRPSRPSYDKPLPKTPLEHLDISPISSPKSKSVDVSPALSAVVVPVDAGGSKLPKPPTLSIVPPTTAQGSEKAHQVETHGNLTKMGSNPHRGSIAAPGDAPPDLLTMVIGAGDVSPISSHAPQADLDAVGPRPPPKSSSPPQLSFPSPSTARPRCDFAMEVEKAFAGSSSVAPAVSGRASEITTPPARERLTAPRLQPGLSATSSSPYVVRAVEYVPSHSSYESWEQDSVTGLSQPSEGSQLGDNHHHDDSDGDGEGDGDELNAQTPSLAQPRQLPIHQNPASASASASAASANRVAKASSPHPGTGPGPLEQSFRPMSSPRRGTQEQDQEPHSPDADATPIAVNHKHSQSLLSVISSAVSEEGVGSTPISPASSRAADRGIPSSRGRLMETPSRVSPVTPHVDPKPLLEQRPASVQASNGNDLDLYADANNVVVVNGRQVQLPPTPGFPPSPTPLQDNVAPAQPQEPEPQPDEESVRYSEERPMSFVSGPRDASGMPQDQINTPPDDHEENAPPVPKLPDEHAQSGVYQAQNHGPTILQNGGHEISPPHSNFGSQHSTMSPQSNVSPQPPSNIGSRNGRTSPKSTISALPSNMGSQHGRPHNNASPPPQNNLDVHLHRPQHNVSPLPQSNAPAPPQFTVSPPPPHAPVQEHSHQHLSQPRGPEGMQPPAPGMEDSRQRDPRMQSPPIPGQQYAHDPRMQMQMRQQGNSPDPRMQAQQVMGSPPVGNQYQMQQQPGQNQGQDPRLRGIPSHLGPPTGPPPSSAPPAPPSKAEHKPTHRPKIPSVFKGLAGKVTSHSSHGSKETNPAPQTGPTSLAAPPTSGNASRSASYQSSLADLPEQDMSKKNNRRSTGLAAGPSATRPESVGGMSHVSQFSHVSQESTKVQAADSRLDLRYPSSPAPFKGIPPQKPPPGAPAPPKAAQPQRFSGSGAPEGGKKKRFSALGALFGRGHAEQSKQKLSKEDKKNQKAQKQTSAPPMKLHGRSSPVPPVNPPVRPTQAQQWYAQQQQQQQQGGYRPPGTQYGPPRPVPNAQGGQPQVMYPPVMPPGAQPAQRPHDPYGKPQGAYQPQRPDQYAKPHDVQQPQGPVPETSAFLASRQPSQQWPPQQAMHPGSQVPSQAQDPQQAFQAPVQRPPQDVPGADPSERPRRESMQHQPPPGGYFQPETDQGRGTPQPVQSPQQLQAAQVPSQPASPDQARGAPPPHPQTAPPQQAQVAPPSHPQVPPHTQAKAQTIAQAQAQSVSPPQGHIVSPPHPQHPQPSQNVSPHPSHPVRSQTAPMQHIHQQVPSQPVQQPVHPPQAVLTRHFSSPVPQHEQQTAPQAPQRHVSSSAAEPQYETPQIPAAYRHVSGAYVPPEVRPVQTQQPVQAQHPPVSATPPHANMFARQYSEPHMQAISPQISGQSQMPPNQRTHSESSSVSMISPISSPSPAVSTVQSSFNQRHPKQRMSSITEATQNERPWHMNLPPGATEQDIIRLRHQQHIQQQIATQEQLHAERTGQSPSPRLSRNTQSPSPQPSMASQHQAPPNAVHGGFREVLPRTSPQPLQVDPASRQPDGRQSARHSLSQQAPQQPGHLQTSQAPPPASYPLPMSPEAGSAASPVNPMADSMAPPPAPPPKIPHSPMQSGFPQNVSPSPNAQQQRTGTKPLTGIIQPNTLPSSQSPHARVIRQQQQQHQQHQQQQNGPLHPGAALQPGLPPNPSPLSHVTHPSVSPPSAPAQSPTYDEQPPRPAQSPAYEERLPPPTQSLAYGTQPPHPAQSPAYHEQPPAPAQTPPYQEHPPHPAQSPAYEDHPPPDEPPPSYDGPGVPNDGLDKEQPRPQETRPQETRPRPPNIVTDAPPLRLREPRGDSANRHRQPSIGILQHPQPASMAASPQRSSADMGADILRRRLLEQQEREASQRMQRNEIQRAELERERQERERARARARELERSVSNNTRVESLRSVTGSRTGGSGPGWERRGSATSGGAPRAVFELPAEEDDEPVMRATSFPGQEWVPTFTED